MLQEVVFVGVLAAASVFVLLCELDPEVGQRNEYR